MSIFKVKSTESMTNEIISINDPPPGNGGGHEEIITVDVFESEKLLVIPISKEIARDFSLIGYDVTIRHIEEILSQASKRRNVILYGDNGVGKTAITQGLVKRKNCSDLSIHMYKRTFYRLNTSRLMESDDIVEINKRFEELLVELNQYDVLVIENFYTISKHLRNKGASAILISFMECLERKKFQAILTCNTREKILLLNDIPEIHEFFVAEKISEPNSQELLNILRGVNRSYEHRYGVLIPDNSLKTISDLSQKYRNNLEDWAQPGRALIALDRAISQFSVQMNSKPEELVRLENERDNIFNEIDSLSYNHDENIVYDKKDVSHRDQLTSRLNEIKPKIIELREEWDKTTLPIKDLLLKRVGFEKKLHTYVTRKRNLSGLKDDPQSLNNNNRDASQVTREIIEINEMIRIAESGIQEVNGLLSKINLGDIRDNIVTPDHIAQTYSEITGVSFKQLNENEKERLLNMENIISQRVYGQEEAIQQVSNATRRAGANLSDGEGTPKGSFLFLGPSGVGKTELAKALSEFVTGSEKNLIRIDMSEFMEKHSVSRLIGAPPGYAGYENGGVLTNAVRDKPRSVVLFDEIEKAHEDVFKILLQVLDDGRLTDSKGETVSFDDTYIVLTSNAGTPHFLNDDLSYDEACELAMKDVEKLLLPEIRGRLDSIICFKRLGLEMLEKIAHKRYKALNKNIAKRGLRLEISDEDTAKFCKTFQDPRYGGRVILKSLKKTLEEQLAVAILSNEGEGSFTATFEGDRFNPLIFTPKSAIVN